MRQSTKKQLAVLLDFDFDFPEIQDAGKPSITLHKNGPYLLFKANDLIAADALRELIARMEVPEMREGTFYALDSNLDPESSLAHIKVQAWDKVDLWEHLNGDIAKHPFCELLRTYGVEIGTAPTLKNYIRKTFRRREMEATPFPWNEVPTDIPLFDRACVGTPLLCTQDYTAAGDDVPTFTKGSRYMVIDSGGEGADKVVISTQALEPGKTVDLTGNGMRFEWTPFDPPMETCFDDSESVNFGEDITQRYPERVAEMQKKLQNLPFMLVAAAKGTVPPIYPHTRVDAPLEALKSGVINTKLMRMGKSREAVTVCELWGSEQIVILSSRRIRIFWKKNLDAMGITDYVTVNCFADLNKPAKYYLITYDWFKRQNDPGKKDRRDKLGIFHPFVRKTHEIVVRKDYNHDAHMAAIQAGTSYRPGFEYGSRTYQCDEVQYNLCPHCKAPMVRPDYDIDPMGKIVSVHWTFERGYRCRNESCYWTTDNQSYPRALGKKVIHRSASRRGAAWATYESGIIKHKPGTYVDYELAAHLNCNEKVKGRQCPTCKVADGTWQPGRYKRMKKRFTAVVLDEIHNAKTRGNDISQAAFNLRCRRRIGLTGTFMSNSAMDTYLPLHYVLRAPCPEFPYSGTKGENEFKNRFCDFVYLERPTGEVDDDGNDVMKTVKKLVPFLKNPPDFWRFLASKIVRRTYDDPLYQASLAESGLFQPTPVVEAKIIPMNLEQSKLMLDSLREFKGAYEKVVEECLEKHQEINMARLQNMSQMMSMRILATCPEMINTKLGFDAYLGDPGGAKGMWVETFVAEEVAQGRKVLILSDFLQMQATCEKLLERFNPILFRTHWTDAKIEEVFSEFEEDPEKHVLIAGTRAIREGVDVSRADTVICTDLLWSPAYQTQAWSRILAPRPEDRLCKILLLLAEHSVDKHIFDVFYSKVQAASQGIDRKALARRAKIVDVKMFVDRILENENSLALQVRDMGDEEMVFMPELEMSMLEDRV